jgi:pilus assembly protein Flp/PilA
MKSIFTRFAKDESGATAIEYGLIAAGLAVVLITVFSTGGRFGTTLDTLFTRVTQQVNPT